MNLWFLQQVLTDPLIADQEELKRKVQQAVDRKEGGVLGAATVAGAKRGQEKAQVRAGAKPTF